jgi:hypothetical protein
MKAKRIKKILSAGELSLCLGISPRRIQQLSKVGIMPKRGKGEYELYECMTAYFKFLRGLLKRYTGLYKRYQEQCLKRKTNFPNLPYWEDVISDVPELGEIIKE